MDWAFFLSHPDFQKKILGQQSGATRQALTKEMMEAFELPCPPIETQREIVNRLHEQFEHLQQLKSVLTDQLAALEKLPGAYLREAFGHLQ